jgi:hypothetical protein
MQSSDFEGNDYEDEKEKSHKKLNDFTLEILPEYL